jgi:hypothetical protein
MKKSFVINLLLLCIPFFSCKKEVAPVFVDSPVIEAYFKSGDPLRVKISRQVAFSSEANYSPENIDSLQLYVNINNIDYPLLPQGNGIYQNTCIATEGESYRLHFEFNGKPVSATTTIPARPVDYTASVTQIAIAQMTSPPTSFTMPDPVKLSWTNMDDSYYLVVVENIETNPTPIRDTADGRPDRIFRNQPTTSATYEIRAMEFQYYGTHRLILYHLNPDYAALYNNTSNSSQSLATPQTDIVNGIGIFTGINADTLLLEVTQ